MEDLSLHVLDIAENALRAKAKKIIVEVVEDEVNDCLTISIKDDGEGIDKKKVKNVLDPFFTTKEGKRIGLGLSILSQAVQQTGGELVLDSEKGIGTTATAVFKMSHPDMVPMGDINETILVLTAGSPSIQFIYNYKKGDYNYHFDSFDLKET